MNTAQGESDEPDASLDIIFGDEVARSEAAGIEASLAVVAEEEVLALRDVVPYLRFIAARGRMLVGAAGVAVV